MKKINLIILIYIAFLVASCASAYKSDIPTAGYEYITSTPYEPKNKATITHGSFKYYVAPKSKAKIKLDTRNDLTGNIEQINLTTISVAKAWPHGGVRYYVQGFACDLEAGTYVPKKGNSNDWDNRFQTEPYESVTWNIWKYVCAK